MQTLEQVLETYDLVSDPKLRRPAAKTPMDTEEQPVKPPRGLSGPARRVPRLFGSPLDVDDAGRQAGGYLVATFAQC